jgi:hypothetical protein
LTEAAAKARASPASISAAQGRVSAAVWPAPRINPQFPAVYSGAASLPERRETGSVRDRLADRRAAISANFGAKQQAFLDFVLAHYVSEGVRELDQEKLTPLLRLRYHDSLSDAVADLGRPEEIGKVFSGFQKYLYQRVA